MNQIIEINFLREYYLPGIPSGKYKILAVLNDAQINACACCSILRGSLWIDLPPFKLFNKYDGVIKEVWWDHILLRPNDIIYVAIWDTVPTNDGIPNETKLAQATLTVGDDQVPSPIDDTGGDDPISEWFKKLGGGNALNTIMLLIVLAIAGIVIYKISIK